MAVDIGKLNKRVTFLRPKEGMDNLSQDRIEYEDYCTVWATVKPFKAADASISGKRYPEATHKIYVRYREDLSPYMRMRYNGRELHIIGPLVDLEEKHELYEIQAEERYE